MTPPFSSQDLGRIFDAGTITRGRSLGLAGRVEVQLEGDTITAVVQDSGGGFGTLRMRAITASQWLLIGRDGVVFRRVECVILDVEFDHFLVRDFHVLRIKIAIDLVANLVRFRLWGCRRSTEQSPGD